MADDVEIITTQRGFQRYDQPWQDTYGHTISVYESSAASGPHVWLALKGSPAMGNEDYAIHAHLNIEQAEKLRRELSMFIDQAEARWAEPAAEGDAP